MSTGGRAEQGTNVVEIASRLFLLPHIDAWHALAAARLTGPEEAMLRIYARQEWERWPALQRATVAGLEPCRYASQAARDAMARILWRRAEVSQDARARSLGVRSMEYRRVTKQAEALLRAWLRMAALGYLVTLSDRDGFTPASRHTGNVELARPPTRPDGPADTGALPLAA